MYKIEKEDYGFRTVFSDFLKFPEMLSWLEESKKILENSSEKFGLFVDIRNMKPMLPDAQLEWKKGMRLYEESGMERAAFALDDPVTSLQFKRLYRDKILNGHIRYADASQEPFWERRCLDWITKGIEPQ